MSSTTSRRSAGRRYSFKLDLEIDDSIALLPGELGTYLLDALFALDQQDLLFPGLRNPKPGERILGACIGQIGYERGPNALPEDTSLTAKASGIAPRPERQTALLSSLEDAILRFNDLMRGQRLISAKAQAVLDQLRPTVLWTQAQRDHAARLTAALEAVITADEAHVQPLL